MNPRLPLLATAALLASAALSFAAQPPLKPIPGKIDLQRYSGSWRLIAVMDNRLEHDFVDAQESYTMLPKNKVGVHLTYRDKSFTAPLQAKELSATIVPDGTNTHWKLHVFPLISFDYVVIDLTKGYQVVTIANPSRSIGAILARHRTISPAEFEHGVAALKKQGYDTSKLIRLPQVPPKAKG